MAFIPIEFQKINEKTQKDCIRINAKRVGDNTLGLLDSKFGGIGYFPEHAEFPNYNNEKLRLLAQINCAELPDNAQLPKSGLLQFYIANNDEYYGMSPDAIIQMTEKDTGFAVRYWEDLTKPSQTKLETGLYTENDLFPIVGEYKLDFIKDTDYASISSIECAKIAGQNPFELLEDVSLNDEEEELFYNNIEEHNRTNGHKLLGNASFANGDPREDDNYSLLLQIDADFNDDNDIMWGDQGVGQFFIIKDDLSRLDFSKVYFSWDC